MKRLSCSDSSEEDKDKYEEEDGACSYGQPSQIGERKRRLSVNQVKALEKNFEVDNKLDPERKVRLAQEVGLPPRQVAVWFQNRRARRKAKQLERDYGDLAARHDALVLELDALRRDKEALQANVEELRAELARTAAEASKRAAGGIQEERRPEAGFGGYRDGGSDSSDSSVAFGDGMAVACEQQRCLLVAPPCFLGESRGGRDEVVFSEEPCSSNFFAEEQPPCLPWFCSEGWD